MCCRPLSHNIGSSRCSSFEEIFSSEDDTYSPGYSDELEDNLKLQRAAATIGNYGCHTRVELGIRGYLLDSIFNRLHGCPPPPNRDNFPVGVCRNSFLLRSRRPALAALRSGTYGDCPFPPSGNSSPCWWLQGILPVPCRGPDPSRIAVLHDDSPASFMCILRRLLGFAYGSGPVAGWATMVYQPGLSMGCWLVAHERAFSTNAFQRAL